MRFHTHTTECLQMYCFYSIDSPSVFIQATYTPNMTMNSSTYSPDFMSVLPNYYYEAVEVNVIENGMYTFNGDKELGVKITLYQDIFNPFNPHENLIRNHGMIRCTNRLGMIYYLKQNVSIAVITTAYPNQIESFSIFVLGPNNVTLKHRGK